MKANQEFAGTVQAVGEVPAIAAIDAVAIYSPKNGKIIHLHHAVTFAGAEKERNEREQKQRALESARRLGHEVDGFEVLHVPDFQPSNRLLKVDLKTRKLVGEPAVRPDADSKSKK